MIEPYPTAVNPTSVPNATTNRGGRFLFDLEDFLLMRPNALCLNQAAPPNGRRLE